MNKAIDKVNHSRRHILLGAGVSAALMGLGALPSRPVLAQGLVLNKDPDLLRACMKMRFSLGPEMSIGWVRAKRFAVSQGRIEPVCGFVAATFSRLHQVSDKEFEVVAMEITHYTDFETGELLDTLVMPFSNKKVKVPPYRFGPFKTRFAVNLDEKETFAPAANTNENEFAPASEVSMTKSIEVGKVDNGDLFLRHEEYGRVYPSDAKLPSMFYKESTIWSSRLAEVLDPKRSKVNSTVAYSAMTIWRPWMDMGDLPGHTSSNGFGRRANSVADLPEDFLQYTRKIHPDVVADPKAILDSIAV
jgi:hypothetical protein